MTIRSGSQRTIVFIFFVLFLGVGLFIVKDYGISMDEGASRDHGIATVNYIFKHAPKFFHCPEADHGPFFEIILVFLEKGLHLTHDLRAVYLMRHLATFLLFYLGVIFFYKLCNKIFSRWYISLLGCLFLVLSPRIFADAFYNSKDIPCLSFFILCAYTLINYLENKTLFQAFTHAFLCAALIDTRIMGIIVPFLTFLLAGADIYGMCAKGANFKRPLFSLFLYCFFLVVFTILFWPNLWPSPLNNFIDFLSAGAPHWKWTVLYLGQFVKATCLPWHYIPVWIAISTPLLYVVFFCVGYGKTVISVGRNPARFYFNHKGELISLLLISLPILADILFKPCVLDAWRHFFFIYPFFLVFVMGGLRSIFGFFRDKRGAIYFQAFFICCIFFNLGGVFLFMVRNHPYQNVYFNSLAGRNMKEIKTRFEMDYWGLSYTKALEYIVRNDSDRHITYYLDRNYIFHPKETEMLNPQDTERLVEVYRIKDAKYFLSDYRWHPQDYNYKNEFYSVKVDGAAIVVVYRL